MQIRQGDVLLTKLSSKGSSLGGYNQVPRDNSRIVLAHGEATGHAHAITEQNATLYQRGRDENDRILRVEGNVVYLRHEEHTKHEIPPGLYTVVRQREWSLERQRYVED